MSVQESSVARDARSFYTTRERDIVLRVRAKPGCRVDRVAGVRGDSLLVEVRAPPERGRANDAVMRILADSLGIRLADVVLKLGAGSPRKLFILPRQALPGLERLARAGSAVRRG